MSKGQRIRLGSRSRRFRGFENRIAREHLAAIAPPDRVLDGVRKDVPAVAVPAHVDRAKHSILVLDVEDVGVAVVQENTVFTLALLFHEGKHLGERRFRLLRTAEFSDDGTIHRGLPQLVVAECLFRNRIFGFAGDREEPFGEVVAEVADLDLGFAASVTNELLFGDEVAGGCRDHDRRDELEDRGCGFRLCHLRDVAVGPAGLLAEELLELLFPLVAVLATEVHDELIERSGREFAERFAEHGIHGQISFLFGFPLRRGGTMVRCGHSEERPKIEPLFAMTNSQFLSKNYITIIHLYYTFVNTENMTYFKAQSPF